MKKTMHTLMTAAAFAVASSAVAGSVPDKNQAAAMEEYLNTVTATYTQTVYGPTGTTSLTTTTTSTTMPAPLYGPPPSALIDGDINFDNVLDARDLTLLKRRLMDGSYTDDWRWRWDPYVYDINEDGEFNKEDVKALRRLLTGKSQEEEEAEERQTTTMTTATTTTTSTTTTKISNTGTTTGITYTATFPTETFPIDTAIQPVYGPPPGDLDW